MILYHYCIYIMIYHIFIRYLESPKWLYTRINYSVNSTAVTLLYCTTLYVLLTWLHLTISTSLGMYPKMDKWKIKMMIMMMMTNYNCQKPLPYFLLQHYVTGIFSLPLMSQNEPSSTINSLQILCLAINIVISEVLLENLGIGNHIDFLQQQREWHI